MAYKLKTRSAAKKRFRKVGGKKGVKLKRASAYRRHLLTKKSTKRKRQLRKATYVNDANFKHIIKMLSN